MKHTLKAALYVIIFTFGAVSVANAALIARGSDMVYDTDLDITWLADANYAKTSGFDADGRMNWTDANAWAASLNIGGVTGWRLPTADPACGLGFNCTDSEMGHLFYDELGGTVRNSILTSGDPDLALFSNVQSGSYWSGTEVATPPPLLTWFFRFDFGFQGTHPKINSLLAWAVHDGDVGATNAVPVPGTIALMGLGVAGLLGFKRRKH